MSVVERLKKMLYKFMSRRPSPHPLPYDKFPKELRQAVDEVARREAYIPVSPYSGHVSVDWMGARLETHYTLGDRFASLYATPYFVYVKYYHPLERDFGSLNGGLNFTQPPIFPSGDVRAKLVLQNVVKDMRTKPEAIHVQSLWRVGDTFFPYRRPQGTPYISVSVTLPADVDNIVDRVVEGMWAVLGGRKVGRRKL